LLSFFIWISVLEELNARHLLVVENVILLQAPHEDAVGFPNFFSNRAQNSSSTSRSDAKSENVVN
jgi:hypothetical protein